MEAFADRQTRRKGVRAAVWRLIVTRPEIVNLVADELVDCMLKQEAHEREELQAQQEERE